MGEKGFEDLIVWQNAKNLAVKIYRLTEHGHVARDFGLRDQIRRSAVSLVSNVAKGNKHDMDKAAIWFVDVARARWLNCGLTCNDLDGECAQLGKMIGSLLHPSSKKILAPLAPGL